LTDPINWLFTDLAAIQDGPAPITQVNGQQHSSFTSKQEYLDIVVPLTQSHNALADMDYQEELLEWLGLVLIGSPRISKGDKVDPYLCRYELPQSFLSENRTVSPLPEVVVHLRWRGLLPSAFVLKILWTVKEGQAGSWFALNGVSFEGNAYTILFGKEAEVLVWELD
jgi:ribonuclease P/MRP protein subunit RPP40